MQPRSIVLTALGTALVCLSAATPSGAQPAMPISKFADAPDGGRLHYDGMFYDYLDADARKAIKLWTPPGSEPMQGILFHGNPGGSGDTRELPRDRRLQEWAARHRLGIIGVTWIRGWEVYDVSAPVIYDVLDAWAKLGDHPEIANVPLIARGSSNAGMTAYGLACYRPERMLCFTPNVGPRYNPLDPSDAALQVPAWLHIGPKDPLIPDGMTDTQTLFAKILPRAPRWAWDAQKDKGHEIGFIDDVDMHFYVECLRLRLPQGVDPRSGPMTLNPLPRESGWLVDLASWEEPVVYVAHFADYTRDKATAGWLPDAGSAMLYRTIAGYNNRLKLTLADVKMSINNQASGVFLRSEGGPLVDPGTSVTVNLVAEDTVKWSKIELYTGADLLGTIAAGSQPVFKVDIDPAKTVYAFHAIAYDAAGKLLTVSNPAHVLVRDPAVSEQIEQRQQIYDKPALPTRAAAGADAAAVANAVIQSPSIQGLHATALTAGQEASIAASPGTRPAFWDSLANAPGGVVRLDSSLTRPDPESKLDPAQSLAEVAVTAAYSRSGLYLLFGLKDISAATAQGLDDAIDLHISRESSSQIWDSRPAGQRFVGSQYALSLAGVQYQMPVGTLQEPGRMMARNIPSPFDLHRLERTIDQLADEGIVVSHLPATPDGVRQIQWFIPWRYVGVGGDDTQPPAGTRLGLALGYNDTVAPGQGARLRWPYKTDPWAYDSSSGTAPGPWGDLVLDAAATK